MREADSDVWRPLPGSLPLELWDLILRLCLLHIEKTDSPSQSNLSSAGVNDIIVANDDSGSLSYKKCCRSGENMVNLHSGAWRRRVCLMLVCRDWETLVWCQLEALNCARMPTKFLSSLGRYATPSLRALQLMKTVEDYDLAKMSPALTHLASSLTHLDLSGCNNLTDRSMQVIACVTGVTHLNLSMCEKLTAAGIAALRPLEGSLSVLDLSLCKGITDAAMAVLSQGFFSLSKLCLFLCSRITDQGLLHVSCLPALRHLDLTFCRDVTDRGIRYLTSLVSLTRLDLFFCRNVSDKGVKVLSRLSSLTQVHLHSHSITDRSYSLVQPPSGH